MELYTFIKYLMRFNVKNECQKLTDFERDRFLEKL